MPGLVLEGGTFRPVFSCGVMDALLDHDIMFDYVVGVSAGITYAISYLSRQRGRNLEVLRRYRGDSRYFGVRNLPHDHSIFGTDFVFDTIPNQLIPFDWETYHRYKGRILVGVTNAETGRAAILAGAQAVHPGYGFLSENSEFAKLCEENGIVFIGPNHEMMDRLGDKIQSKLVAMEVGVPTIPGVEQAIKDEEEALKFAVSCGYPVILKAAAGGGGRGMRIVRTKEEMPEQFRAARSEAKKAFGIDDVFIEKYLENPKHIEVQIFGDNYGNIVHLGERDCSIQRRHQKVVEFTPALCLTDAQREAICADAIKIRRYC